MAEKLDGVPHYFGWFYFRTEPWQWPPGTIRGYYAPLGTSIGLTDANGDGGDDRVLGTIRIPSYAAALSVIPNFVTANSETLDVGLLAERVERA